MKKFHFVEQKGKKFFLKVSVLACFLHGDNWSTPELRGMRDESRPVPGQDGTGRDGMKKFANLAGRDGMKKFANLAGRDGTGQEGAGCGTGRDRSNSLFRPTHFSKAKSP